MRSQKQIKPPLAAEDVTRVRPLSAEETREIDAALLGAADLQWRKVALVVARAMSKLRHLSDLPEACYGERIRKLVEAKNLEAQGKLSEMRFSEVRLPSQRPRSASSVP